MLYRTYFKLTNCVADFEEARQYLAADDMTKYLIEDKRASSCKNKIKSIKWILKDSASGYIDLETTDTLSDEELNNISNWVRAQHSDGIGEGFTDQPFATYEDEGLEGYEGSEWDNEMIIVEFDWTTNDYKFERMDS